MRSLMILGVVALVACTQPPQLNDRITPSAAAAPYPDLQPLAPLLAQAAAPGRVTPRTTATLTGSAADLRARATALRGPVVDDATRARMRAGIDQAALR
ncbi:hypothetical protein [Loktanella sp. SALINAS62]|uniref:hypothetical protein n=1 Tax=Loktanella sp. SALINAS62 TaxID=2706124 RepID=UPI001B8C17BA|nr:hypothetical protein [Loktanella sp. SALINAS62]MBS1303876.1 hypothetical protein [Loktanella sp. SALINAS62]